MRAKPLELPVRPELNDSARVEDLLRPLRDEDVVVVAVGRHRPPPRPRVHNLARREREQPLVLPHVGVVIPVVLAEQAAVPDDQRRRVADLAPREQLDDVLVDPRHRQRVLEAGVPVEHVRLRSCRTASPLPARSASAARAPP